MLDCGKGPANSVYTVHCKMCSERVASVLLGFSIARC